jgi:hypothetical protein
VEYLNFTKGATGCGLPAIHGRNKFRANHCFEDTAEPRTATQPQTFEPPSAHGGRKIRRSGRSFFALHPRSRLRD